ncbi:squalene-hopene cyclase [Virgibacillus soli]|nr:squalene-hopene cyclase [Virgibacillus soli]
MEGRLLRKVDEEISRIIAKFFQDQSADGSWSYPFEMGIVTDCYTIILLRILEIDREERLIKGLVHRIMERQEANGAWKLYQDEKDGNLSATVEAYFALLYSGYKSKHEPELIAAEQFIRENGGLAQTQIFTKIMLAIAGQYKWSDIFPIPLEFMLLPDTFPINFFDFSVFARANLAPLFILSDKKFTMQTQQTPNLSELLITGNTAFFTIEDRRDWGSILDVIEQGVEALLGLPEELHQLALTRTNDYIMKRIEPNGTLESYFSATYFMIFAFLAQGYEKKHSIIARAVEGIKSTICQIGESPHIQYTTANVWNTALISYALQEAGVPSESSVVERANQYLQSRQQHKLGDWALHNPNIPPGGWGFSDINTINPDVDDSTAALRAMALSVGKNNDNLPLWNRGIQWVMSMQNDDGGWPAFERNIDQDLLTLLPIERVEDLVLDPSTPDLTGRTLEFLGHYSDMKKDHPLIRRGIDWLLEHQQKDGSWDARWGIYYIYGTWAAVTGLRSVGIPAQHPALQKAVGWLQKIQLADGGWGESCNSDKANHYISLQSSTRSHTAWALDALIATATERTPQINSGIEFLIQQKEVAWTREYPKGQGMAGAFYIHYHSYDLIWPLVTLAHYKRKFYS